MKEQRQLPIRTARSGLVLRLLFEPRDAQQFFDLVDENRSHLSRHGDETAQRYSTLQAVKKLMGKPCESDEFHWGIWSGETLLGAVDLLPERKKVGRLRYWLGSRYCQRGYATESVGAVVSYAFESGTFGKLVAAAHVKNIQGQRVLEKTGFVHEYLSGKISNFSHRKPAAHP